MTASTVAEVETEGEPGTAEASRFRHEAVTRGVTAAIHWLKVSPTVQLYVATA
jgi:hypothetical protein